MLTAWLMITYICISSAFVHYREGGRSSTSSFQAHTRTAGEWHVWKAVDELNANGLSSVQEETMKTEILDSLIADTIQFLESLGNEYAGEKEWSSLLNKANILHEVEESIVALSFVVEHLNSMDNSRPITLVDVCAGKGILSMLASYVFRQEDRLEKIIMLDKASMNWHHIAMLNENASKDTRKVITSWSNCNLHEIDDVIIQLESLENVVLVGIHLCKNLSPTFLGITNLLGQRCSLSVLAPCCLPRTVTQSKQKWTNFEKFSFISVRQFESLNQRTSRLEAKRKRKLANSRRPPKVMSDLVAGDIMNSNTQPELSPSPCWKCGEYWHRKADCPSTQTTSKPKIIAPPSMELDVTHVLSEENPFKSYCEILATSISDEKDVKIVDSKLVNPNGKQHGNWNDMRKSIFITAK